MLAADPDPRIRHAVRSALANIGDPAAGPVLSRSRLAAPFGERSESPALYLLFARRLAESGRTSEGVEAARAILGSYDRPEESHFAAEALAVIVSAQRERALPDLLLAMDSRVRAFRGAALALAPMVPGPGATARWTETGRPTLHGRSIQTWRA